MDILCPMCGTRFSAQESQAGCQACPLHQGCSLVRCPACGFETIDPNQSSWARWFRRLLTRSRSAQSTPEESHAAL